MSSFTIPATLLSPMCHVKSPADCLSVLKPFIFSCSSSVSRILICTAQSRKRNSDMSFWSGMCPCSCRTTAAVMETLAKASLSVCHRVCDKKLDINNIACYRLLCDTISLAGAMHVSRRADADGKPSAADTHARRCVKLRSDLRHRLSSDM